jgi:anaerobic selenocysteine-containing dehydrogenase
MRVRGLSGSVAGLPTAALPDEMLLDGSGRVRALISVGGNPAAAWPDQAKTVRALESLELFVQIDPWMSASSKLAHYVIAPKMPLEMPSMTLVFDQIRKLGRGLGTEQPYGQYSRAICDPPPGSELVEEWEFFYELARRMRVPRLIMSRAAERVPVEIDLRIKPSTDEVFDLLAEGSRVPLNELRASPGGHVFERPPVVVAAKQPGWEHKLDVGRTDMMADLAAVERALAAPSEEDTELKLVCRRMPHVYNSSCNHPATNHGRPFNPAFMHPDDMDRLGIFPGDHVEISTPGGLVEAIAEADQTLRRGLVSMTHCFGGVTDEDVEKDGSSTSRLLSNDRYFDRYAGQPRMSNVPVWVIRKR